MALFIGLIGMVGAPCCLIWLIVSAIRSGSKKTPLIGILVSCVLFFSGVMMFEPDDEPVGGDGPKQADSVKYVQSNNPPESTAEDKMEVIPVKKDTEEPEGEGEVEGAVRSGEYQLPCGVKLHFFDSVRNDVTSKWRRSGTSSSLPPSDFAIEYYEKMFSSSDEIHSVWNAALKTTTKIYTSGNLLFVDTFEYVDGEEQDANEMFSGMLLESKIIDLKTGKELEESEPEEKSTSQKANPAPEGKTSAPKSEESKPATKPSDSKKETNNTSSSGGGGGGSSNFYTYDNEEQQKTEDSWVLNTSSMKIHYPTCREVKKIAPHNYSTSSLSESELKAKGYTTCGVCH